MNTLKSTRTFSSVKKDLPADIVHKIRKLLRGVKSEAVCGKSKVIGKSIDDFIEKNLNFQIILTKNS